MTIEIQKNLATDIQILKSRIDQYAQAWSTKAGSPNWSEIEQLYAPEDLLHYDAVTPYSFANVSEMKTAFVHMRETLKMQSLELKARDDLRVFRRGDLVWTTVSQDIVATLEDQTKVQFVQRQTGIWEQRNGKWVMIHEHLSVPSSLQA